MRSDPGAGHPSGTDVVAGAPHVAGIRSRTIVVGPIRIRIRRGDDRGRRSDHDGRSHDDWRNGNADTDMD
jgi:hypothetical protein